MASVEARSGADVWGVVYQIDEVDTGRLDASEGYRPGREMERNSYVREERHVYADGNAEKPLLVCTYIARAQPNPPLPNDEYKRLLVGGARFWRLPDQYLLTLERIEVPQ